MGYLYLMARIVNSKAYGNRKLGKKVENGLTRKMDKDYANALRLFYTRIELLA